MQKLRSQGEEGQGKEEETRGQGISADDAGGGTRREHTVAEGTWPKVDVLKKEVNEAFRKKWKKPRGQRID